MKRPVIGVLPNYEWKTGEISISKAYLDPLLEQGAVPFLLPFTEKGDVLQEILDACSGLLLSGGPDIHPVLFGEDMHQNCGQTCPLRDTPEMELVRLAAAQDKPVLGICRGVQAMNVALGGTLYQDIPSQTASRLCHAQKPPYSIAVHRVQIERESLLYQVLEEESVLVNSMHHQAVKTPAPSLTVAAVAPDGGIEALWRPENRFFLGVQWHPECMYASSRESGRLFQAFIDACREEK